MKHPFNVDEIIRRMKEAKENFGIYGIADRELEELIKTKDLIVDCLKRTPSEIGTVLDSCLDHEYGDKFVMGFLYDIQENFSDEEWEKIFITKRLEDCY